MRDRINSVLNNRNAKTIFVFTGGNLIVTVIGGLSGLLYGRWITPDLLGEFNKYGILTGYLGVGIIFFDAAFQRNFPVLIGKGDTEGARREAAIAKWGYLFLLNMGALIYLILIIKNVIWFDLRAILGWFSQITIYAVATYGLYLKILYRSNDDFLKLNRNMLITAFSGVFLLPVVYFFNFYGLVIRSFFQNLINIISHAVYAPLKVEAKFEWNGLKDLMRVSLPLQIPVYLDNYLINASVSLIILDNLGQKELGIYSMALMLQGFILVFSQSITQVFTTKIMMNYGSHGDLRKGFKYILKPTLLMSFFGLMLNIVFVIMISPIVDYALPKYSDSVVIVQIFSFELFLSLLKIPFTIFVSALMYKEMVIIRMIKVGLTFLLLYLFHENIFQIALVLISVSILYVLMGYFILLYKLKSYRI
jgi:O-antigen/teichoic acid export membrane protein